MTAALKRVVPPRGTGTRERIVRCAVSQAEYTALYRIAHVQGETVGGWIRRAIVAHYKLRFGEWPPIPPLLALTLLCAGCWTTGPVVADVRQLPDGGLEVRRCMVQTSWAPPGVTQDLDLVDCKTERRAP